MIPFILLFSIVLTPRIEIISIPGLSSKVRLESLFSGFNILLVASILIIHPKFKKACMSPYLQIGIVLLIISMLVSENIKTSLIYFLKYLELFSFFVCGYLLACYSKNLHNFNLVNLLLVVLVIFLTILDMFDVTLISSYNNYDGKIEKGRVSASFNLNYDLGAFVGLIFLQIWLLSPVGKITRSLFLIVLGILIYFIGSRSAQLALFVSLIYLLFIHDKNYKLRRGFFLVLLFLIPYLLATLIINGIQDPSIAHRIYIWTTVMANMDPVNYLFGGGAGYINSVMSAAGKPGTAAESFYLRLLFEHGILGIALYLIVIYKWYISGLEKLSMPSTPDGVLKIVSTYQYQKMISSVVIYIIVFGLFIDINLSTKFATYCYFVLGMCLGKTNRIMAFIGDSSA